MGAWQTTALRGQLVSDRPALAKNHACFNTGPAAGGTRRAQGTRPLALRGGPRDPGTGTRTSHPQSMIPWRYRRWFLHYQFTVIMSTSQTNKNNVTNAKLIYIQLNSNRLLHCYTFVLSQTQYLTIAVVQNERTEGENILYRFYCKRSDAVF